MFTSTEASRSHNARRAARDLRMWRGEALRGMRSEAVAAPSDRTAAPHRVSARTQKIYFDWSAEPLRLPLGAHREMRGARDFELLGRFLTSFGQFESFIIRHSGATRNSLARLMFAACWKVFPLRCVSHAAIPSPRSLSLAIVEYRLCAIRRADLFISSSRACIFACS